MDEETNDNNSKVNSDDESDSIISDDQTFITARSSESFKTANAMPEDFPENDTNILNELDKLDDFVPREVAGTQTSFVSDFQDTYAETFNDTQDVIATANQMIASQPDNVNVGTRTPPPPDNNQEFISPMTERTPELNRKNVTATPWSQETYGTSLSKMSGKSATSVFSLSASITGKNQDKIVKDFGLEGIPEEDESDTESEKATKTDTTPAPKTYQFIYPQDGTPEYVFFRIGEAGEGIYQYYDLKENGFPLKNTTLDEIQTLVGNENVKFEQYKPGESTIVETAQKEPAKFQGISAPLIAKAYIEEQIPDRKTKLDKIRELCNFQQKSGTISTPDSILEIDEITQLSSGSEKQMPSSLYAFLENKNQEEVKNMKYEIRKTDWLNSIIDSTHDELVEFINLITSKLDIIYKANNATELSKNVITAAGTASQPKCHAEQGKLFRNSITYLQTKINEPRVDWLMQSDAAYIGQYDVRKYDVKKKSGGGPKKASPTEATSSSSTLSPEAMSSSSQQIERTDKLGSVNDLETQLKETLGVKNISIETGRGISDFIIDYDFNYVIYPTGMDAGNRMVESNYIKQIQKKQTETVTGNNGNLYVLKHHDKRLPFIKNILSGKNIQDNINELYKNENEDFMNEKITFSVDEGIKMQIGSINKTKFTITMNGIIQPPPTAEICKIIPDDTDGTITYVLFEENGIYFILKVEGAVSVNNLCSMCGIAAKRGDMEEGQCQDIDNIKMYKIQDNKIENLGACNLNNFVNNLSQKRLNTEKEKEATEKYYAVMACLKKDGDGRFVAYSKYLKDFFTGDRGQLCCASLDILCINELVYNGVITLGCVKASKGQGKALPVNLYCPDTRSSQAKQGNILQDKKRVLTILLRYETEIRGIVESVFENLKNQLETDREQSLDMVQFEVANSMLSNIESLRNAAIERVNTFYNDFIDKETNQRLLGDKYKQKIEIYLPLMPTSLSKWVDDICMLHTFFTEYQDKLYSLVKPQDCYLIPDDPETNCNLICSTDNIEPDANENKKIEPSRTSTLTEQTVEVLSSLQEKIKKRNFDGIYDCIMSALAGMLPVEKNIQDIDIHVVAFFTQMILANSKTNEQLNDELAYIYYQQLLIIGKINDACGYPHLVNLDPIDSLLGNFNKREYIQDSKNEFSDLQAMVPTKKHEALVKYMSYEEYTKRLLLYLKSHKIVRKVIDNLCAKKISADKNVSVKIDKLINKYHILMLISVAVMRMHYYSFYKENSNQQGWYNIIEGDLYQHISTISGKTIYENVYQLVRSKKIKDVFILNFNRLKPPCQEESNGESASKRTRLVVPDLFSPDSPPIAMDSSDLFGKGGKTKKRNKRNKRNMNTNRKNTNKSSKKRRQTKRKKIIHKKVKKTHKNE
jgi:hypothetical protein